MYPGRLGTSTERARREDAGGTDAGAAYLFAGITSPANISPLIGDTNSAKALLFAVTADTTPPTAGLADPANAGSIAKGVLMCL